MHSKIAAVERDFRNAWQEFDPSQYEQFLARLPESDRAELLLRLLSAELEYSFQPPSRCRVAPAGHLVGQAEAIFPHEPESDDERVRPCVQLFLMRFPSLSQDEPRLIRLIVLEYALRLHYDRLPPNPESYLELCSEGEQLRLVRLLELTEHRLPNSQAKEPVVEEASRTDSTIRDAQLPSLSFSDPLPTHLGCYLLTRLIGRGGMGFVHSAIDLRSTARVALKVMRRIDAWSIYRFFEEFRWLSQLEHPNLVKLYNAYTEGNTRYFSMELVEGDTIQRWFKSLSPQTDTRWTILRKVLSQLASAVGYLHENRVIHCDIKCSNMMITERMRAVVLDLGLSVREGQSNPIVGTIQYMAPEVLDQQTPTRASDWYSFGVMMYEVMSGKYPPIEVNTTPDGKATYKTDSEALRSELEACPADLRQLCLGLIAADPQARPRADQILAVLGGQTPQGPSPSYPADCPGRDAEIRQLQESLGRSILGDRRCVVLHGESGIGKSRILRCWLHNIDSSQYVVASIGCYYQDHTPYRLLNALVQELLLTLPSVREKFWVPGLEKRFDRIVQLFPQAAQLLDDRPVTSAKRSGTPAPGKECIRVLVEWLAEISSFRPFIIAVDDAQWADPESVAALASLQQKPEFQGLVVLANNSGDADLRFLMPEPTAILDADVELDFSVHTIAVLPLDKNTCLKLLEDWMAEAGISISSIASERLTRFADGNPFLLSELARAYISDYSTLADDAIGLIGRSNTQNTVRRRFASLPRDAEMALEFLAVANQPLGFHQLQMLTRSLPPDLLRSLSLLRSQGWIRSRPGSTDTDVEVAHERFRRVIVQGIQEDRLWRRHARIARVLSNESPPPWSRIAGHYWSANRLSDASECYIEAARGAYTTGAIEDALFFLDRASHPIAVRDVGERLDMLRLKADCLACNGSSREAAEAYESLASKLDGQEHLLLRCLAGEQWIRAGQPELGIELLQETFDSRRIRVRSPSRWTNLRLVAKLLLTRITSSTDRRAEAEGIEVESLEPAAFGEIDACLNRLAAPLTFLENQIGQELVLHNAQLASRSGSLSDRAQAILRTGLVLSFAGKAIRLTAARRLRSGRQLAVRSGLEGSLAAWNFSMFLWYVQKGNIRRSIHHALRGISRFQRTRERFQWEQQFLTWGVQCSYFHSNQLLRLREYTASMRDSASQRKDPMSTFWMHVCPAHLSDLVGDETLSARKSLFIAEKSIAIFQFQVPQFFLWLSRIHQSLYEGKAQEAQQILLKDWKQLTRSVALNTHHYAWLALHTRVCCDLVSARVEPEQTRHWIADARRCARRMLRLEEPPFVSYARALLLVIDAVDGKIADDGLWKFEIAELERHEHHLTAAALKWQYCLYKLNSDDELMQTRSLLTKQGCINPERLLNVVIPLPY